MKVLVTGGLGFIGSNIAERLVSDGHEVSVLDNMHTGSESNIESARREITVQKRNSGDIASIGERFEAVLHQGVYSSSPMYKENPHLTATAIDEWISILEYARKTGCKIVFASSSSLYNGNNPPHREDMQIRVTDYYTEARYAMERLAKLYADLHGVSSVGLRYFSVYGPHERSKGKYANLITQFLWERKEEKRPLILGDGLQSRDFVYVDDVVEANMLALKWEGGNGGGHEGGAGIGSARGESGRAETGTAEAGTAEIFNVGTGKGTDLNSVVALLNSKLGTDIEPRYEPNRIKNYVSYTLADTHKAQVKLGFASSVGVEEGVERLIRYYSP